MGHAKHIGRIGALAVALGVGLAIGSAPVAHADDPGSSASADSSSTSKSAASKDTAAKPAASDDTAAKPTASDDTVSKDPASPGSKHKRRGKRSSTETTASDSRRSAVKDAEKAKDDPAADAPHKDKDVSKSVAPSVVHPRSAIVARPKGKAETAVGTRAVTSAKESVTVDATESVAKPTAVQAVTPPRPLVASVVRAVLQPLLGTGEDAPLQLPVLTAVLSAVRDELECNMVRPGAKVVAQQTVSKIADPRVSPAAVGAETTSAPPPVTDTAVSGVTASQTVGVRAAANTLTYTAPPDLIDQLTVAGLRVARDISALLGVNFGGIVGSLVATQDPPFFMTFGLTAQQTQYEISEGNVWKVWTFTPPNATGKAVIGVHGGGFIVEPNFQHWIDYTSMARDTGATVVVPIYPLAKTPDGAIVKVQPVMADFVSQQIDRYGAENVSIHADSGGVTHALGAVRELIRRGDSVPASMVLLSGQANYSPNYNPDIYLIDDPYFDIDNLDFYVIDSYAFDGITGGEKVTGGSRTPRPSR